MQEKVFLIVFPGGFTPSKSTESENQEIINILTPRLPDSKVLSYNDIDEGAGSYSSALDDKAFERKSDRRKRNPNLPKLIQASIRKVRELVSKYLKKFPCSTRTNSGFRRVWLFFI